MSKVKIVTERAMCPVIGIHDGPGTLALAVTPASLPALARQAEGSLFRAC